MGKGFRNSIEYKNFRDGVLEYYDYTCEDCGGNEDLTLSHNKAVCLGGDKMDLNNSGVKCYHCHKKRTKIDMNLLKKVNALIRNGDLIEI